MNVKDNYNQTPLNIAIVCDKNEVVKALENHLKSTATIRQTARFFHQGTHGVNENSDLNKLPNEILLKIAGDTRTADTHSDRQIEQIATEGFNRPSP